MRRPLIAGNWKMNGLPSALIELDGIVEVAARTEGVDVVVCPPFTLIADAVRRVDGGLLIGAQDCHAAPKGAHTGCIAAPMLAAAGAEFVIVGHSERRADDHGEPDTLVKAKAIAAIAAGLVPIVCVGETASERQAGSAEKSVLSQIRASLPDGANGHLAVAYEPVWAIGSGRVPSSDDIRIMHREIRAGLEKVLGPECAEAVRILYGGSLNASNADEIFAIENVDGGLIGAASLAAATFTPIITAIQSLKRTNSGP